MQKQTIKTKVAGTSFRQFDWGLIKPSMQLKWRRQPENQYDSNAIALFIPSTEVQIGFINAHQAAKLAPHLDDGVDMTVVVTEVTGGTGHKTAKGINLELQVQGVDVSEYFDLQDIWGSIA